MSYLLRVFTACWCAALAGGVLAQTQTQTLRIGASDLQSDSVSMASAAILSRAYAELKQPMQLVELPGRRTLKMLLAAELDGNLLRVAGLAQEQPALFMVPTPVVVSVVRMYAVQPQPHLANWAQLAGLRVAHRRGVIVVERNLPTEARAVPADSVAECMRMVTVAMADVCLSVEPLGSPPTPLAEAAGLHPLDGILAQVPLHHYLLDRHRKLGARLNQVLQRMQASGETQSIQRKALEGLR